MKITFVCRQMTVDNDVKETVTKKLSKLEKYFWDEGDAKVTFSEKRNRKNLEVTINASNTLFRSEVDDESFLNALDKIIDNIERQIRKNKTRLAKRIRSEAVNEAFNAPEPMIEEDPELVIRTKTFGVRPMTVEDAILQMNLLGHQFFVFVDQDRNETCVVYTRKDGTYGLIVPEK